MCCHEVYSSLLQVRTKNDGKDVSLPNPHGSLSSNVPPRAIEAMNNKVAELIVAPLVLLN